MTLCTKTHSRRAFLKYSLRASTGAAFLSLLPSRRAWAIEDTVPEPDLVAVRGGAPDKLFDTAVKEFGGLGRFVTKGQTVLVKPNIGWDRPPESGANSNPLLIKRIVEHCFDAGAKRVIVSDNSVSWASRAYKNSGIESAAKAARATVAPADKERYYQKITIPNARVLKTVQVHEAFLEADVVINVPVLKHHQSTELTAAMKNLMGVVWDRGWYHRHGLNESIADFCLFKKPDLNVVDAYIVTLRNGPSRAGPEDIQLRKSLWLSRDIVAADAASAKFVRKDPAEIAHIRLAGELGLGKMNLSALNIRRISL